VSAPARFGRSNIPNLDPYCLKDSMLLQSDDDSQESGK
jgi:hypothetical protein